MSESSRYMLWLRRRVSEEMLQAVNVLVPAAMDQLDQCEVADSQLRTAIEACAADQNEERALKKFGRMTLEFYAGATRILANVAL